MTERSDLAQRAAEALASAPVVPQAPSPSQETRAVALVAGAIRARRQRARRLRWTAAGAVAAAAATVLALGAAWRHAHRETPSSVAMGPAAPSQPTAGSQAGVVEAVVGDAYVIHGDQGRSVVEGSFVSAGDRLVVQRGGHVAFVLPTGTRLAVDEGADFTVVTEGTTQIFRLAAGSVRADVHKLVNGERFLVRTRDGEIEVRGTSFRLADVPPDPSCGAGTTTRLSVYEGVVAVRVGTTETRVAAGQSWPADCGVRATDGEKSPGSTTTPVADSARRSVSTATLSSDVARSQLADQNDMYARAITARESGHDDAAIAAFERLVAKYPSCPLAENALAERMKLLSAVSPRRAAEAARDYLARYPLGFARADADTILSRGASDR